MSVLQLHNIDTDVRGVRMLGVLANTRPPDGGGAGASLTPDILLS